MTYPSKNFKDSLNFVKNFVIFYEFSLKNEYDTFMNT